MNRPLSFVLLAGLAACSQEPALAPAPEPGADARPTPTLSAAPVETPAPSTTAAR